MGMNLSGCFKTSNKTEILYDDDESKDDDVVCCILVCTGSSMFRENMAIMIVCGCVVQVADTSEFSATRLRSDLTKLQQRVEDLKYEVLNTCLQ